MKISKLFHWLYAILMFLPIMVFIPNAFYYGFNEHAVAQEKTEQAPVYYESNVVNSVNDILDNRYYHFEIDDIPNDLPSTYFIIFLTEYKNLLGQYDIINTGPQGNIPYVRNTFDGTKQFYLAYNTVNTTTSNYRFLQSISFDFLYNSINNQSNYLQIALPFISECTNLYPTGEYLPVTTNMSITDSLSYAWDSVWQNGMFSWTYDSFLTQPFLYITNLFNVPSTNTLVYCLSYWLNISIIWLTFDLVMYIPLLVHRWLDKGVIE